MSSRRDAMVFDPEVAPWVRWVMLVMLAVPQLITGVWAVIAPRNWFDEFPGLGPLLVAAEPPFNRHLATDVGAGFLATGVALLIATIWPRRRLVMLALITYLTFAVPHTIYHAAHEAPGLSSGEDAVNVLMLSSSVIVGAVLLWGAWRSGRDQEAAETGAASSSSASTAASANDRSDGTLVNSIPNQSR